MANIFINNNLRLENKCLKVKDYKGDMVQLHHRQGNFDGACGVYSTIMGLLALGYISYKDVKIGNSPNKRGKKGKMLSHFLEQQGLIRDGYYTKNLANDIREYCNDLEVKVHYKEEKLLCYIHDTILENNPVVVMIESKHICHYVLAVGFEYEKIEDNNDLVTKLLCLDPDQDLDASNYWNCVIDVTKEIGDDFNCCYITDSLCDKVRINNIMTIEYK